MYANKVLRVQYAVFILTKIVSHLSAMMYERVRSSRRKGSSIAYLTCCVYNLSREILAFDSYNFAECVLNGRVVTLNEVTIHELYSEGRFA